MNAPITSLRNDQPSAGNIRNGQFAASKTLPGQSASRRSADLFEQLLMLPQVTSSSTSATAPPVQPPVSQSSPSADANSSDEGSEDGVANDEDAELSEADSSEETSTSAEAAAAALAASDTLIAPFATNELSSSAEALPEASTESSVTATEPEIESATANVPGEEPITSDIHTSTVTVSPLNEDVDSQSLNNDLSSTLAENAGHVPDAGTVSEEKVADETLVKTQVEPGLLDAEKPQELDSANSSANETTEQSPSRTLESPAPHASDHRAKDERKGGRDKWYEREAREQVQNSTANPATQTDQTKEPNDANLAANIAVENRVEIEQVVPTEQPELTPFVVDSLPNAAPSIVSESWLVGAGLTGESLGSPTGTTAAESEQVDGSFLSTSNSPSRRATTTGGQPTAAQPGDAVDLTQQEKIRLIQRVTRSFTRLGVDGGQIHLKLHPPQLGSLNVQVRLEGRSMTAKLTTETSAARDAIMESLPVLKNRLAEQGFEVSQFQVEVATNDNTDASFGDNRQERAYDRDAYRQHQPGVDDNYRRMAKSTANPLGTSRQNQPTLGSLNWQPGSGIDVHA